MNSKSNNVYDLSRKIEEQEQRKFQLQAKNIANAYRKVESLKVASSVEKKQQTRKEKPQSNYALKVKETLKEINANKNKELQSINKYMHERPPTVPVNLFSKLQKSAVNKLYNLVETYNSRMQQESYKKIKLYVAEQQKKEQFFINKFRMYKLFRAWREQVEFQKLERLKDDKKQQSIDMKSLQLAKEFHYFVLLKKAFKGWAIDTKRQVKRKKYEQELMRQEIKQKIQEEKSSKSKKIEENSQLQSKVRGFLDGLKEKIEQKDRLKTIKEKTEESRQNENSINVQENEMHQESIDEHSNENSSEAEPSERAQIVIQPPAPQAEKKPMTNEDLEKKRKQLQLKHKSRKQTLQKLRKQKQQKRKEDQKQRSQLQRQIQLQQKRIKQQKYKEYMRNKQEQQEWQRREKQLIERADQFNTYRLKKYYGWIPMASVQKMKIEKASSLYSKLLLIVFRIKGETFLSNLREVAQQKQSNLLARMQKRYQLNLLKKAHRALQANRKLQLQQKDNYSIRHEVNTLKIFFSAWQRVTPILCSENYDWQRPRNKRAEQFYKLQLLHKALKSLRVNQQLQLKEKCIAEQKNKIKSKIKNMLEDNDSFNYQQFL